jgi:hypothetical protein
MIKKVHPNLLVKTVCAIITTLQRMTEVNDSYSINKDIPIIFLLGNKTKV